MRRAKERANETLAGIAARRLLAAFGLAALILIGLPLAAHAAPGGGGGEGAEPTPPPVYGVPQPPPLLPPPGEPPAPRPIYRSTNEGNVSPRCGATDSRGEQLRGVTFTYRGAPGESYSSLRAAIHNAPVLNERMENGSITLTVQCHYPPAFTESAITCVLSVEASVNQVVPTSRTLDTASRTTAYAGNRTVENCRTSSSRVDVYSPFTEFGRYEYRGTATVQECFVRTYLGADAITGQVPAPELTRCSPPIPRISPPSRWQLTCDGFIEGWTGNPSWTLNDCGGGESGGRWQCSTPAANSFDGTSLQADEPGYAARDGAQRRIVFGVSEPRGQGISLDSLTTQVVRGSASSPALTYVKLHLPTDDHSAPSRLGSTGRTQALSGAITQWDLSSIWASEHNNRGTRLTAHYTHDLTYSLTTTVPVAWEWDDVNQRPRIITRTQQEQVSATADCQSEMLEVVYVRAVNDR